MPKRNPSNIAALAEKLHLSKGTISRILNGDSAPFAKETQVRVHMMAEEMGYTPNPIAKALATGKTGAVCLWLQNLKTSYHALVAEAMENLIEDAAHRMTIRLYERDWDRENEGSQLILDTVDGVISHGRPPDSWMKPFLSGNHSTPIVFTFAGDFEDADYANFVGVNLEDASRQAIEHLISSGRKRVAFFSPSWNETRMKMYMTVMKEVGREPEVIHCFDSNRPKNMEIFKNYVQENGCPDALFCHNDICAISAYHAACNLGIKIPDDMALIGCDGLQEGQYLSVPLSTIIIPVDEMARYAWQILKTKMEYPDAKEQKIWLNAKLALRESSRS